MKKQTLQTVLPAVEASADSTPALALSLLGRPQICVRGVDVSGQVKYRKGFCVLAYLAVNQACWVSREKLASLLWPQRSLVAALTNLRQVLNNLRTLINADGTSKILRSDRNWVGLFPDAGSQVDLACLMKPALAQTDAEDLGGVFLEGFELSGCDEFEDWLRLTRQHLRNRFLALMEAHCQAQQQAQNPEAIQTAHYLVQQNPLDERATGTLMTLLQARGARRAALSVFDTLQDQLLRELQSVPDATLQRLRQHLLRADSAHSASIVDRL